MSALSARLSASRRGRIGARRAITIVRRGQMNDASPVHLASPACGSRRQATLLRGRNHPGREAGMSEDERKRADRVYDVSEIESAAIENAPKIGLGWRPEYVRGIGKRGDEFIIIPEMGRIFATLDGGSSVSQEGV